MELIFWGIVVSVCLVFLWFHIRQDLTEGLEDELDGFSSILDNDKKAKPKPKVKRTNINQSRGQCQSHTAFDEIVDAIDFENHSQATIRSNKWVGVKETQNSMNNYNHDTSPSYSSHSSDSGDYSSSSSYDSSSSYSSSSSDSGGF